MNIPYTDLHIHREIGAGAYGKVFVGEWQMTTVAMKISGYSSSTEFMREAALLVYVSKVSKGCQNVKTDALIFQQRSNLRPHPNVVQFLGVSKSTDGVNIVMIMEYCAEGEWCHDT